MCRYCHGHIFDLETPLSLSLSHSFSLSNPSAQIFPGVFLGNIFQPGDCLKFLQNIILPISHRNYNLWSKNCSYIEIETIKYRSTIPHSSYCQTFMLTHWPPHVYCSIHRPKFDSEIKIFSIIFTRDVQQQWDFMQQIIPGLSGFLNVLGRWTTGLMLGGFRKWRRWLFLSYLLASK